MRFYVVMTNYGGGAVSRYFADKGNAEKWLNEQDNGNLYEDYDKKIHTIPYEGCTGDDVRYWNEF